MTALNRRSFVRRLLAGAAGVPCLPEPCLPGALAGRRLSTLGAQLYTVRRELEKDFEGTLAGVAALGFREVEFAGYHNRPPARVKAALEGAGLNAPSAHVPVSALRGGLREVIEAAHTVGHKYLVCAYLPAEERRTLDDYRRLAELFNRAGEQCRQAGIQFGYHNHDFEFAPLEGAVPYDLLLARTDARLVKLELDLYWITKANQSPLDYFRRHPGRFPLVHVKDMDATPRRYFTEAGRGVVDFKSIFAAARRAGVRHYFVEQDETPGPPLASLKASLDYLKRLEF